MAQAKTNWTPWIIGGIAFVLFFNPGGILDNFMGDNGGNGGNNGGGGNNDNSGGEVDIKGLVDGTLEFAGKRMFVPSTLTTNDEVRVMNNGFDEGDISLNGGSVSASPDDHLTMYFGHNGTTYYTDKQVLTYPVKEVVKAIGEMCYIDTAPTITSFDEYGRPATSQAVGTNEVHTLSVRIKATADKCFGNPESDCGANALCIYYNSTEFTNVKATNGAMGSIGLPFNLSTVAADIGSATSYNCYKVPKVKDGEEVDVDVELTSGDTDPSTSLTYYFKDCAFDLNADDLSEIWGFEDEDNNVIGAAAYNDTQQIT